MPWMLPFKTLYRHGTLLVLETNSHPYERKGEESHHPVVPDSFLSQPSVTFILGSRFPIECDLNTAPGLWEKKKGKDSMLVIIPTRILLLLT